MNDSQVILSVPRDTSFLGTIRRLTVDLAKRAGLGQREIDKVEMAIDEACANAVLHQDERSELPMELRLTLEEASLTIALLDRGAPYPFESYGLFDLAEHHESDETGGLGIYIIKHFMDEVRYEHLPGVGNLLTMSKFRQVALSSAR